MERTKIREKIEELAKEFHRTWKPWQKKTALVLEIHELFKSLDITWTQKDTADFLDHSYDHISESCRLAQALKDPECEIIREINNRKFAIEWLRGFKKWQRI